MTDFEPKHKTPRPDWEGTDFRHAPFYDDDHDLTNGKLGPYRPLHPMREGFTMGFCLAVVLGIVGWLLIKVL